MRRGEEDGDKKKSVARKVTKTSVKASTARKGAVAKAAKKTVKKPAPRKFGHGTPSERSGLAMVRGRHRSRDPQRRDLRGRDRRSASRTDARRQSAAERGCRRSQRGSAEGCACGRQAARQGRRARPAARRAHHDQGQCRLRRPAEFQRRARQQGLTRAVGFARGAQSEESRRDRHRPHQHAGILLPRLHRQSAARADAEPLGPEHHLRRLLGRRGGGRRRHRHHRPWQRHRRLAALAGALQRRRHDQADAGSHPRLQRSATAERPMLAHSMSAQGPSPATSATSASRSM